MSDVKHTSEPWKIGTPTPNGEQTIGTHDGLMVAVATTCAGVNAEANARRIVAAVNYCAGMENVTMEYAVSVGLGAKEHLLQLAAQRADAERQRDQLLNALELIVGCEYEWASGVAERAIAAVKGGA